MADDRKIVIELKSLGSSTGGEPEPGEPEDDIDKVLKERKEARKTAMKKVVGTVFNQISSQVMYEANKYLNLSEDYKSAILIENVQTTINKVKSLASNTVSFAKAGALFGLEGATIGAAIGVGVSVVSEGLNLIRQYDAQNINLAVNDKQSQYAMSRLGLIDNGRGTQN